MRTPDHLPIGVCWRRKELDPRMILIHFISAKRDHPDDPYNYAHVRKILVDSRVSAHEGILRNGDVKEWVPVEYQSWGAGTSKFGNLEKLNKYAIQIEVFGSYDSDFTKEQYISLADSVNYHMHRCNIPTNMVKGHSDVSGPLVRKDYKVDPGPMFDWLRLGALIERLNTGMNL